MNCFQLRGFFLISDQSNLFTFFTDSVSSVLVQMKEARKVFKSGTTLLLGVGINLLRGTVKLFKGFAFSTLTCMPAEIIRNSLKAETER